MFKWKWGALACVFLGVCILAFAGCGGEDAHHADGNLPIRRAKMRELKISADLIMAALKNESVEGVESNAKTIQANLNAVVDLYTPDTKDKYVSYNREAQSYALALATAAGAGNVKEANKQFRGLMPYCGKCHEDCAFMLAPAFPEYEQ